MAGIALRRLLIASLCDQLSNANGFVRRIVLEHAEPGAADSDPTGHAVAPTPASKTAKPRTATADDDLRTLAAKLGGWDSDLADLEAMEKDIKFVMDEDQKRTLEARRKR